MKRNLLKYPLITSFVIVLLFSNTCLSQKNDATNYLMRFNFSTVKQSDNSRLLKVDFIGTNKKDRKDKIPVLNAEINFYNILNEEKILLGKTSTSIEGVAQLLLKENHSYLKDDDGNIHLIAQFPGTDSLTEETSEISVKDLHLELNLTEIDSIKTVIASVFTLNTLAEKIPVDDLEIGFYVQAMLSKMKFEEGSTSDGTYQFNFPTDIPGDFDNNVIVSAMILDHDDYWNVTKTETVNWGFLHKHVVNNKNTLWSEVAPLWMYTLLTIMLVGVWANYIYTIIHLFKIKNEGNELKI